MWDIPCMALYAPWVAISTLYIDGLRFCPCGPSTKDRLVNQLSPSSLRSACLKVFLPSLYFPEGIASTYFLDETAPGAVVPGQALLVEGLWLRRSLPTGVEKCRTSIRDACRRPCEQVNGEASGAMASPRAGRNRRVQAGHWIELTGAFDRGFRLVPRWGSPRLDSHVHEQSNPELCGRMAVRYLQLHRIHVCCELCRACGRWNRCR